MKKKKSLSFSKRIANLKDPEKNTGVANPDIKELIHELQTYKIELELQNEELLSAQRELERSRNKYLNLFDTAPVGFFTLEQDGNIIEANEKGAALLGVSSKTIANKPFQQYVMPDSLPAFYSFFNALTNSSTKTVSEIQLLNTGRYVQMEGLFFSDPFNKLFIYQLALVDVTLRKKEEARYAELKLSRQKETLNTILQTQEEERIRIAEALHNGLGQLLYATRLKLEDIRDNKAVKQKIREFLEDAITETRNLSFTLMPTLLKDFGLKIILEETARRFSTAAFTLECQVTGINERLPGQLETVAFRIIQELVSNVLRHSESTLARITVKKQQERLIIKVKDNGIGFDPWQVTSITGGTGLKSIQGRLELLNGTMSVASVPGKGTTITIIL
jgi:PAS domain S-box-containing protein